MTFSEWWLLYEVKSGVEPDNKYAGNMTRGDVEELSDWMKQDGTAAA